MYFRNKAPPTQLSPDFAIGFDIKFRVSVITTINSVESRSKLITKTVGICVYLLQRPKQYLSRYI